MKKLTRHLPALALGICLGVTGTLGQSVLASKNPDARLPLEDLRTFTEVFAKVKNDYVEPIEDRDLLENAIHGMLSGLDPHSSYLIPEDYQELQAGTSGEFGGLGSEVERDDGVVHVISPIDDTPAQRAGMKSGDLIIELDGVPVKGMPLTEAVKVMRGVPGSAILLTVIRNGVDQPFEVEIIRDVIKVTSIRDRLLEPGYVYVRSTQFQSRTGEILREALSRLREQSDGDLDGIVLDLRNNPGGVLSAAVSVSAAFLQEGTIVYTEGRHEEAKLTISAKPTDILSGAPIVVLVNSGSASASEIVAGALKDHSRATIMGETTFGKGTVQTILPMENGAALKLTTARYYTPSGNSIQATGVTPHIELTEQQLSGERAPALQGVSERDLAGQLDGDADTSTPDADGSVSTPAAPKTPGENALASEDYALFEALSHLKKLATTQAGS